MDRSKRPIEDDGPLNWPGRGYSWYLVMVLAFAYMLSHIDRQVINLLVVPIKRDLGVSDTQISLLLGFSFAIFYAIAGLPIARLADRANRKVIITAGVTVWSMMTALSGVTKAYWQLLLVRIGVGVGEATLTPAAYSIMADCFPRRSLARAIGIYSMGGAAGGGMSLIIGGVVLDWAESLGDISIPIIGNLYSWQVVFFVVGLPGLLLATLIGLTVREPLRRYQGSDKTGDAIPLSEAFIFLNTNRKAFAAIFGGVAITCMAGFGAAAWMPTFFIRYHGWKAGEVGLVFGLIAMTTSAVSALGSGWIGDKLYSRGIKDAALRVSAISAVIGIVPMTIATLVTSSVAALILYGFGSLFLLAPFILGPTAVQMATPNRLRATVSAVYLFIINLVGMGLGPMLVALQTDYVFQDESKLGYSIALLYFVSLGTSAFIYWRGMPAFRATMSSDHPGTGIRGEPGKKRGKISRESIDPHHTVTTLEGG
ncbi:MAG: MFS transporter [Deltaproteobacteria bacterium]|nr:MFS transporter [Deltaproteobacteria bacterium]